MPSRILSAPHRRLRFVVELALLLLLPAALHAQLNITRQPESVTVQSGQPATLSVGVTATPAPTFQWRRYGYSIPGATTATYHIPAVSQFDNDFYDVVITSGGTTALSQTARLLVTLPSYPGAVQRDLTKSLRLEGWGNPGEFDISIAQAVPTDGRFYLAGNFTSVDNLPRSHLVRFRSDGTLDTSYTPPTFDGAVRALALQSDGKLIVAGAFGTVGGAPAAGLVRLNADGSPDASFSLPAGLSGRPEAVFVAPDGSIYLVGRWSGAASGVLAKLTSTGAIDSSFRAPTFQVGAAFTDPSGFAIGPSGLIHVHGRFDAVNGVARKSLVRLLPDGQVDPSFNPGIGANGSIHAIAVLGNGRVVIGGDLTSYNGTAVGRIARVNTDGTLDSTFATGAGFATPINFVAELPGDMVFVASPGNMFKGVSIPMGIRLTAGGALDSSFVYPLTGLPSALTSLPGNRLLVSGKTVINSHAGVRILESNGSLASGARPELRFPAVARLLAPLPGGKVLVAGNFTHANGTAAPYVMRLNPDLTRDLTFPNGPGPIDSVTDGVVQPDGKLFLKLTSYGVMRLNADGSTDSTVTQMPTGGPTSARPVVLPDGRIFVPTAAPWWGATTVTNGFVVLESNGTRATNHPYLPGPETGALITGVQRMHNRQLLVMGTFTTWNGIARKNIVRLNADGSVDPSFVPDPAFSTWPYATIPRSHGSIQRDGKVIVASNQQSDPLVRFNHDGTRDSTFLNRLPQLYFGPSALVQPDDRIIVTGYGMPPLVGGLPTVITRLTAQGEIDPSFQVRDPQMWDAVMLADNGELLSSDKSGYLHRYASISTPIIATQPSAQSVVAGTTIQLSVTAIGESPLAYQWFRNGVALAGATSATLTLNHVQVSGSGSYSVRITNAAGSVTSQATQVTVSPRPVEGATFGTIGNGAGTFALLVRNDDTAALVGYLRGPKIALVGRHLTLDPDRRLHGTVISYAASGAATSTEIDARINLNGSFSGTLLGTSISAPPPTTSGSTAALVGLYEGAMSGQSHLAHLIMGANGSGYLVAAGPNVADGAAITIQGPGNLTGTTENGAQIDGIVRPGGELFILSLKLASGGTHSYLGADHSKRPEVEKLLNISTRSVVSASTPSFSGGFVITGSRAKTVLIRGIGPSLATFNVGGFLPAVRLEVIRDRVVLATSNDWGAGGSAPLIANTAARVGAFPLAAGSRDAALVLTLEPGSYSATVSGQGGATGIALVEVYDATDGAIARGHHIVNISTIGLAGSGENVLSAGFYIGGSLPKRVLVRGAGPALIPFGVSNPLARPQITVARGDSTLATNAGWSTSVEAGALAATAVQVGAFAFANGSADAAVLINLPPGSYTAQVSGVGGTTGSAIVEIYEVP